MVYAIKKCDFRCTKPVKNAIFIDEETYESFMRRAVELGLYKEQKITLFDKVFAKDKEMFVPVEIKEDNSNEYWSRIKKQSIPK